MARIHPRFFSSDEPCMTISDAIYRPFETWIRPLDIPYTPMPASGPVAVV